MQTTVGRGLDSYVTMPRWVATMYREGKITRQERDVYMWLRLNGNPYGVATISFETIAQDCLGRNVSKNYANSILLALKSQKLVYYQTRKGCRGSFELHLGDWPLPRKQPSDPINIKRLDKYFATSRQDRAPIADALQTQSEDAENSRIVVQKSRNANQRINLDASVLASKLAVRSRYNDTDTHKDKDNDVDRPYKSRVLVTEFTPKDYPEEQCRLIASAVGDKYMDFILASVKKHGWLCVERAWKYTKESPGFKQASNKAAYLNSAIQRFSKVSEGESQSI